MFKKIDLLVVLFLIFFSYPFLFFNLGQSSLTSFDEAWYASIAQNMFFNKDILYLKFNGNYFFDHPPFAIWMMTISFIIFGISSFAARFPSAFFSLLTIILVYFLGTKLFNRVVGFCSAIALLSANWFLFRARSGNLDSILTFLFVLNFYLAYLSISIKKQKNKNILLVLGSISLVFLFLTKTMIPLTIFPVLTIMLVFNHKIKNLIIPAFIFILIISFYLKLQIELKPDYLKRYLAIGSPGIGASKLSFYGEIKFLKDYLYFGIGKWFWPSMLGIVGGLLFFQKRFVYLSFFFLCFILPFLFSQKGHIWHLIPVFPFMILSAFGFLYEFIKKITFSKNISYIFILIFAFYFSRLQLARNYNEFINIDKFISEEEILSKTASEFDVDFYIDGDFVPAAAFYSKKIVKQTHVGEIKDLFDSNKSFTLVTNDWRLEREGILKNEYEIIKKDRDRILIWRNY